MRRQDPAVIAAAAFVLLLSCAVAEETGSDIVIYGGTPAGLSAAVAGCRGGSRGPGTLSPGPAAGSPRAGSAMPVMRAASRPAPASLIPTAAKAWPSMAKSARVCGNRILRRTTAKRSAGLPASSTCNHRRRESNPAGPSSAAEGPGAAGVPVTNQKEMLYSGYRKRR